MMAASQNALRIVFIIKHSAEQAACLHRAALALVLCAMFGSAHAEGLDTFSVFDSPDLNRQIHGHQRVIDLKAGPMRLGDASAFFGVDSLSDDINHYLTSGLQWRSTDSDMLLLTLGAMHTAARGADIASQTLLRAETRLALGNRGYLPDLTLEADQLSASGAAGSNPGGRSTRIGFGRHSGHAEYLITYFQAGRNYNPWGSALSAGDRGLEMTSAYDFGSRWRFSNTVMRHVGTIATGTPYGLVDRWSLSGLLPPTAVGRPWRISAQFGQAGAADSAHNTPLSVKLACRTRRWHDWQVDSAFGWFQGGIAAPDAMPVNGGLWQVAASHDVDLAGVRTRLRPSFSIGGSQYGYQAIGSRAGLAMVFPGLLDNVALNVDYLSAGWGPISDRPDMQMTLNITQNAGALMPRMDTLLDRLRARWFGPD